MVTQAKHTQRERERAFEIENTVSLQLPTINIVELVFLYARSLPGVSYQSEKGGGRWGVIGFRSLVSDDETVEAVFCFQSRCPRSQPCPSSQSIHSAFCLVTGKGRVFSGRRTFWTIFKCSLWWEIVWHYVLKFNPSRFVNDSLWLFRRQQQSLCPPKPQIAPPPGLESYLTLSNGVPQGTVLGPPNFWWLPSSTEDILYF